MSVSVAVSALFIRTFLSTSGLIFCCSAILALEPETNCTGHIIPEGGSLRCECRAQPSNATNVTLSWPGHSNTSILTVDSVRREANGTVFTCLVEMEEIQNNTTHTLLVAYGPTNASNVTIMGPSSFTADGTRNLTLTCVVPDGFPSPKFTWTGLCTSSTNTCTLMPQLDQDGNCSICSAIYNVTTRLVTKSARYCLDLTYPPPEAPRITTSNNKTVLSSGDSLTCTVRGGKPKVTSVHFNCTNPTLSDQEDVTDDTSVFSSVVVDTSKATYSAMHCRCSAVWGPEPDLYVNSSDMAFLLDLSRAPLAEDINIKLIAGCASAGVLIMSVVIIVCICRCKRRPHSSKHSAGTDERHDSYAESIMIRNSAYESASVLELSLRPVRTTSPMEPTGHYASVGPAEPSNKAPSTNGSTRTQAYEDVGYAVAGFGLDERSAEQPHCQPTTVPTVSPAPENNVYAVVNKSRKK